MLVEKNNIGDLSAVGTKLNIMPVILSNACLWFVNALLYGIN